MFVRTSSQNRSRFCQPLIAKQELGLNGSKGSFLSQDSYRLQADYCSTSRPLHPKLCQRHWDPEMELASHNELLGIWAMKLITGVNGSSRGGAKAGMRPASTT